MADIENQESRGFLCEKRFKGHMCELCVLVLRSVFHLAGVVHHVIVSLFGVYIIINNFHHKDEVTRFMVQFSAGFGTNWNFLFQTIFLSLSLLYDGLEWVDKHRSEFGQKLQHYRDVVFSGLVVPFTLFISMMFWTVYTIDRELVFPEVYDQIVPWWFNHCVHTNISIVVLVETILQARRYPKNRRLELTLVTAINIGYAIVYYSIFFITGRWLYGVFGIMTWWQVCLYQIMIWGSAFVFYFLQFPINRIFHREEPAEEQKTSKPVDINGDFTKSWSLKYTAVTDENSKL